MKKTFTLFILLFLLFSCNRKVEIKNYNLFWKQKSLNEKYVIYSYCRNGDWAFTDDICGNRIIEADKEFNENNGKELIGGIIKWINKDTLLLKRFEHYDKYPKDTISKITYEKIFDLTLKIRTYKGANAWSLNEYYFNDLIVTREKIILNGIKRKLGEIIPSTMELDYGNIEFYFAKDTLSKITYGKLETSMHLKYKNKNGTITENLPQIKNIKIDFLPTKKIEKEKYLNLNGIKYNMR